jgi:hypothetical protein
MNYDIFISHSEKDQDWVIKLTQYLREYGLNVFIFEEDIRIGESIPKKINAVLVECSYVIGVMTQDWVDSEWSTLEAYSTLFLDPHNNRRKFIPIYLKKCNIPVTLSLLKYLDFRDDSVFDKNFNALLSEFSNLIKEYLNKGVHNFQREQLLSQSMLPWTRHGGLSMGFVIPELFIEPKIVAIKNPTSPIRVNSWLSEYKWNKNIAIVGLPGIGKSTLLKKIFIEYNTYQNDLHLNHTPLFLTVRDLIEYRSIGYVDFHQYIFSKMNFDFKNLKTNFLLFIDGLDEIEESQRDSIIYIITTLKSKNDLLWISSRKEFFFNHFKPNSSFYSLFYDVLEIQEWDIEEDSLKFADDYSKKYKNENLYNQLITLRENSPNINNFLKKPFELTLILYLLGEKKDISNKAFESSYSLYKAFYNNWLYREKHKGVSKLTINDIQHLHQDVSIELFKNRGNSIKFNVIKFSINNIHLPEIKSDSSFWDLLITSINTDSEDLIERFWHETIGEFILAARLIESFCSPTQSIREDLQITYHNEINQFIREGFQQLTIEEKLLVYNKLVKTYSEEYSNEIDIDVNAINTYNIKSLSIDMEKINDEPDSIRVRALIIYYIGRLELNFYPSILSFATKFENSPLLKRGASLGSILYGDEKLERDYIESLIANSSENLLNRSIQLVYFGDVQGDIHSFRDNDVFSWEKARNAIIDRLSRNSSRNIALRWWDLKTLFCFFESREWQDKISISDFNIIKQCKCDSQSYSKDRNENVIKELSIVMQLLQENNCIIEIQHG